MKKIIILLFIGVFFLVSECYATVRAQINPVSIQEGQTFQLMLFADFLKPEPDLSALNSDFVVVSRSVSPSFVFLNGKARERQEIVLTLRPKKTGVLTIPSFSWGKEKTQSLKIEVLNASDSVKIENKSILIEAEILNKTIYEGSGFIYRVKLAERVGIVEGEFSAPSLADAQVLAVGKNQISQETIDNSLYQVISQDFIIFPQKSGDFTLEPSTFLGYYRTKNEQMNFGVGLLTIYQPPHEEVLLRAKPIQVKVLARPEQTNGMWWLPSSNVVLEENVSSLDDVKVGQPITRQVSLIAQNVSEDMLPEINFSSNADFKVYPEAPQKNMSYDKTGAFFAEQTRTFVFIPLKSGKLELPSLSIDWFDVKTGTLKQAILKAKTLNVLPDVTVEEITQEPVNEKKEVVSVILPNKFQYEYKFLYFLFGFVCGLLIGVAGIIFVHQKKEKQKKLPDLYPENK